MKILGKMDQYMDETMKEVYYAYCAIEFHSARIWVDEEYEYIGLSLLQRYRKFVEEYIDPDWENILVTLMDPDTLRQLYNSPPRYFHKFPPPFEFEDKKQKNEENNEEETRRAKMSYIINK